jgi:DNA gyrase/topoisomerase IV subunit A
MHRAIPIFYSEYGRYITRFRSIPLYIDGLIVVYRRVLVAAYNITKNGRFVKSARIVGDTIGKYHPHGDQSCYQSLVKLVRRGFLDPDSNFGKIGAIEDAPASAMRYTECRISKCIVDFAFKYIDYVPWDVLEPGMEKEPLYLPAPLPLGIIGDNGTYSGMAFHRTLVPYYYIVDLAKRLKDLLDNIEDKIVIRPTFKHCTVNEGYSGAFKNILENGTGKIIVNPTINITKNGIIVKGKTKSYKKLFEADYARNKEIDGYCLDLSEEEDCIVLIEPINKKVDLNQLAQQVEKYVTAQINIDCIFCDFEGKIHKMGIDQLLLNNYACYVKAVREKRKQDVIKYLDKLRKNLIIKIIRRIYDKNSNKINSLDDIINEFNNNISTEDKIITIEEFDENNKQFIEKQYIISEKDIRYAVENSSIRRLIETKLDFNKIQNDINKAKTNYFNTEKDCYEIIDALTKI